MPPGLRERKKKKTRELIAETAARMFDKRGFDAVTVAEVARAADVSEGTVFNYFSTKEDLFYSRMERFEDRLVEAVRTRLPGEAVLDAFRRVVLEGTARLESTEVLDAIARGARVIASSPALQAREHEVVARYTEALAAVIQKETGVTPGEIEAWTVANALMGVQRALVQYVRSEVLRSKGPPGLAEGARSVGARAFGRLEKGLAGYALKRK
jgi:AcrR family transcriptional regulator